MASADAAELRQKAEKGHASAMFSLGRCYEKGEGVAQDHAQAFAWYRKAADLGHSKAMTSLGVCYVEGKGIPRDYAQARAWYLKSIEAGSTSGNPEANLGLVYEYGKGVPVNRPEALKWYRASAAKGSASSKEAVERLEKAEREQERLAAEQRKRAAADLEKRERQAALERERAAADQDKRERQAALERERAVAEQKERERQAAEQKERERQAVEQKERERQAAEQEQRLAAARERDGAAVQQRATEERARLAQRVKAVVPTDWDVDELATWLEQLGLNELVAIFKRERIDGESIGVLNDQNLKELGVAAFGLRNKFLRQRDQLFTDRGISPVQPPSPGLDAQVSVNIASGATASNLPAAKALQVVLERIDIRLSTPSTPAVTADIEAGIRKVQEALQSQLQVTAARQSNDLAAATLKIEEAHRQFADRLSRLQTDTERAYHMAALVKEEFAGYLPLLRKMEEKEKLRTNIIASPFHQQYYRAYMEILNATYQAAMVVYSGYVDLNANNTASTLAGALANVGSAISNIPVAGQAVSIAMISTAFLFKKVGERQRRVELGRITSRFPNPTEWFDKVEEVAASITVDIRWNAIAALKPPAAQSSGWFSGVSGFFKEAAALFRGSSANQVSVWQLAAVSDATAALESLMSESSDATGYTLVDRLKTVATSNVWPASLAISRPSSSQLRVGVQLEGRPGDAAVWVPVPGSLDALLAEASTRLKQPVVALRDAKVGVLVFDVSDLRDRDVLVASTAQQESDRQRRNKAASNS